MDLKTGVIFRLFIYAKLSYFENNQFLISGKRSNETIVGLFEVC